MKGKIDGSELELFLRLIDMGMGIITERTPYSAITDDYQRVKLMEIYLKAFEGFPMFLETFVRLLVISLTPIPLKPDRVYSSVMKLFEYFEKFGLMEGLIQK